MYQLLVCGSRTFDNYRVMREVLDDHVETYGRPMIVIHGGAHGADSLASRWAFENMIDLHIEGAKWGEYGKSAGHRRNRRMGKMLRPGDHVYAFVDKPIEQSRGTHSMIRLVRIEGFAPRIIEAAAQ